jgi:outer membrane protein TolC
VSLNISQPIRAFNSLRWDRKIEPKRYDQAKKIYLDAVEEVHKSTVSFFFRLSLAQINKSIAEMNLINADTLFLIASGRYNLGTIAEDDLLQMELQQLNAQTAMKRADMDLRDSEIRLRSFLGFNDQVRLELIIPTEVPSLQVNEKEVLDLAMANNPDIIGFDINILNAESSLAQARAGKGLSGTLTGSLGLGSQSNVLSDAYANLNNSQAVRLTFAMPILDWGEGRGRYQMAKSSLELAEVQANQSRVDFQQNLALSVAQFNLQQSQVAIAAKSDTVAMKRFEVTKQRFLIGKIAVLDLNDADTRTDENRRAYISALQNYWTYFYNMRQLTLFDFINRRSIETDYDMLIKQ